MAREISRRSLLKAGLVVASGAGSAVLAACAQSAPPAAGPSATTPAGGPSPAARPANGGRATPTTVPSPMPAGATQLPASASPTASPAAATGPVWKPVRPAGTLPPARRDHSLTLDTETGALYLFGGRSAGMARDDLWVYDPGAAQWREVAGDSPRPTARFGHNAVWDGPRKRLVVTLGQAGPKFFDDVWAYDPATQRWQDIGAGGGNRPAPRYGSGGALDTSGQRLLITHGFTSQGRFDDTWAFRLGDDTWEQVSVSGPVPVKRCLAQAAFDPGNQTLLLFGGQSNETPFLGDLWLLDLRRGAWTEQTQAVQPTPRNLYGAGFAAGRRRWYIVDGNTADGPVASDWVWDAASGGWQEIATSGGLAPWARASTALTDAGPNLWLFGGNDHTADLNDLWVLEPGTS